MCLSFGGFAFEAGGACFVAGAGVFGVLCFFVGGADVAFAVAVVLDERDAGRTDGSTDAAFYAVKQAVLFEAVMLVALAVPKELLRQEFHRAGVGAARAADARGFFGRGGGRQDEQAVAGFL